MRCSDQRRSAPPQRAGRAVRIAASRDDAVGIRIDVARQQARVLNEAAKQAVQLAREQLRARREDGLYGRVGRRAGGWETSRVQLAAEQLRTWGIAGPGRSVGKRVDNRHFVPVSVSAASDCTFQPKWKIEIDNDLHIHTVWLAIRLELAAASFAASFQLYSALLKNHVQVHERLVCS
eukprot:162115-Chlamydomonas_euryale.AAC.4